MTRTHLPRFLALPFILLLLALGSCKGTKAVAGTGVDANMSARTLIRDHYQNEARFKTLAGRLKIDYTDGDSEQGVTVTLRMEKGKTIWLSAPLGVVKVLITPDRVSYYNKLQNEYFDGDFALLSQYLGTDLDYQKVENLFLGQALNDLREAKYDIGVGDGDYRLTPKVEDSMYKVQYTLDPVHFKLKEELLSRPWEQRLLQVLYGDYQTMAGQYFPGKVDIRATNGDQQTIISLEYRGLELNQDLKFPYTIPNGFEKIELKKDDKN